MVLASPRVQGGGRIGGTRGAAAPGRAARGGEGGELVRNGGRGLGGLWVRAQDAPGRAQREGDELGVDPVCSSYEAAAQVCLEPRGPRGVALSLIVGADGVVEPVAVRSGVRGVAWRAACRRRGRTARRLPGRAGARGKPWAAGGVVGKGQGEGAGAAWSRENALFTTSV
jgi:hypothetical protein